MWFFYYFYFERNYDDLKSKSPCFLLNKYIKFYKNQIESKIENPTHSFREMNHVVQLIKNCGLKVKQRWVGPPERKKKAFFVMFILSRGNSFNICVLSQDIAYWKNFQTIYTFTYQKTLLRTLFLFFFLNRWTHLSVSLTLIKVGFLGLRFAGGGC